MANIHQAITLGIGTPSDIAHLTLFGLSPAGVVPEVELRAADASLRVLGARNTTMIVSERQTVRRLPARNTTREVWP